MGDKWKEMTFGDCAGLVRDTCKPEDAFGMPYIALEHIEQDSLQLNGVGISEDAISTKSRFKTGDILFGKLRPYFRKVVRPKFDGICSTDIWVVRAENEIDQGFIFYWMASKEFVEIANQGSEGTKMPRAKWDFVSKIKERIPPLSEQKAIASILSALDDKIELNRKMNETLEAMARAIFKSWFVDFNPISGYTPHKEWQDSPLGKIPKGWRVIPLGEVIQIHDSKRIPLSSRQRATRQGQYPYYGAAKILDYVDDYLFDGIYVLVGEDGSVINEDDSPVIQYVWGKFWVSNHAHVLQGKDGVTTEHIMLFLKQTNIHAFITGAVQPKLSQTNLCRILFLMSPQLMCKRFGESIESLYARIRMNEDQSHTLASMRDALLPKLLSGEISVKDAERFVENSV